MFQVQDRKVAIDGLRANKVKAFLTMLGVVFGSACIVLVVTVSLAGRNYIVAQIEAVGSNIIYTELVRTGSQSATLGDEITLSDLDAVRHGIPGVSEVAGIHDLRMTVVAERPVTLVAVTDGRISTNAQSDDRSGTILRRCRYGIAQQGMPPDRSIGQHRFLGDRSGRKGPSSW